MRKSVLTAAGLALLAAVIGTSAPAQTMPLSAPTALRGAADEIAVTDKVNCWDGCYRPSYGYYRPWRPYYGYYRPWRPYYAGYGYYRPWRPHYGYYRPYYRPYYAGYGYRPYYRPYGYGYGGGPRPRFYVGRAVYWY